MYGKIEVEADSREEAIEKARELLKNMSIISLESHSSYLADSEQIDEDGIIVDHEGKVVLGQLYL